MPTIHIVKPSIIHKADTQIAACNLAVKEWKFLELHSGLKHQFLCADVSETQTLVQGVYFQLEPFKKDRSTMNIKELALDYPPRPLI